MTSENVVSKEGDAGLTVEKKVFQLPSYTTLGGRTLREVRVGWESYGTLNADKSNAILICHYFSGTSHAAGKYAPDDVLPGYWDPIIGPGKAIDTNRYFVLSSDTLVNLNAKDPKVFTTGPASVDPDTGKPYGSNFPILTIGDFVNVQAALVESLGIEKLHAVAGPSMGGLQSFEWAVRYPQKVGRIMPVIATGAIDAWLIAWLDAWAAPITVDANWRGGAYYDAEPPLAGLVQALRLVSLHANDWQWAQTLGRAPAVAGLDPGTALGHVYAIQQALTMLGADRAGVADANHLLYLVKAVQNFVAGGAATLEEAMAKVKAPVLMISAPDDHVFPPYAIERTLQALRAGNASVEHVTVGGPFGHLNGVFGIAQAADAISAFLGR